MSRPAAAKEPEEALLAAPGRDVAVTATVLALTAVVFALVADHGMLAHIQRADDARLRLMVSGRSAPVTVIAKFFNLLGLSIGRRPGPWHRRPSGKSESSVPNGQWFTRRSRVTPSRG